jgi:hypothetical protein
MKGPDSIIGKTVKCPACQTQFAVTGGPAPEPEPVAAPFAGDEAFVARESSRRGGSWFVEFLFFRRMIAPIIIQFIFWAGSIIVVIVGLVQIVQSLKWLGEAPGLYVLWGVFFGLIYMLLGPLLIRIYCEVLIVFFRMYETMREVKDGIDRLRKD